MKKTEYAYFLEDSSDPRTAITNSERLASQLGAAYGLNVKKSKRRLESFVVDHSGSPLPTVRDAGNSRRLILWRMAGSYLANHDNFNFFLCTGKTECIFSIKQNPRISIFIAVHLITLFLILVYLAMDNFSEYATTKTTVRSGADLPAIFRMRQGK